MQTFTWPIIFAVMMTAALIAGLLGDGPLDIAAILGLTLPNMLCLWKLVAR
jgi:hypothetical protein|tara:strand:+ start:118972 stop:119124 length:153 start_codon:yes stop_codon:yes gene_type:complete